MSHFTISIIKSCIRIASCVLAIIFNQLLILAIGFLIAEMLGILEEVFDKRKE